MGGGGTGGLSRLTSLENLPTAFCWPSETKGDGCEYRGLCNAATDFDWRVEAADRLLSHRTCLTLLALPLHIDYWRGMGKMRQEAGPHHKRTRPSGGVGGGTFVEAIGSTHRRVVARPISPGGWRVKRPGTDGRTLKVGGGDTADCWHTKRL